MSYIDLHAHVLPGVDDGAETLEAVSYTHLTLPTT